MNIVEVKFYESDVRQLFEAAGVALSYQTRQTVKHIHGSTNTMTAEQYLAVLTPNGKFVDASQAFERIMRKRMHQLMIESTPRLMVYDVLSNDF